ncbi:MAG: hypothetical protein ABUK01_07455 [Leptospirales bacterium]
MLINFLKYFLKALPKIIALFGYIALIVAICYRLFIDNRPILKTDDPYIIANFIGIIHAIAGLIFFISRDYNYKLVKPKIFLYVYFSIVIGYYLFFEIFIGGEGAGYGYFFISFILYSAPLLILFLNYYENKLIQIIGYTCFGIYILGFTIMASSR